MGVSQWLALLARDFLSIFDEVYEFQRREPQYVIQAVPLGVLSELAVFFAMTPLLSVDLDRVFLPVIAACDASSVYGYGAALCPCSKATARDLAVC